MSSALSNQRRPNLASDGSRTITLDHTQPRHSDGSHPTTAGDVGLVGALRLRGSETRSRQKVSWREDVIDNEGCGRKSSKICCIYHKPKPFDESSDEDDDSSDEDSVDSDRSGFGHAHSHSRSRARRTFDGSGEGTMFSGSSTVVSQSDDSDSDKNAYETMPGSRKGKHRASV